MLGTFKISEAQEEWLLEQQQWSEENVRGHGKHSEAWRAVGLTLAQLEGLVRGYQQRRAHEIGLHGQTPLPPLGLLEFLKISAVGEGVVWGYKGLCFVKGTGHNERLFHSDHHANLQTHTPPFPKATSATLPRPLRSAAKALSRATRTRPRMSTCCGSLRA